MKNAIDQRHVDCEIYIKTNEILAEAIARILALGKPEATSSRLEYPSDTAKILLDYINPPDVIEEEVAAYHSAGPDPDFLYEQRRDEQMMRAMGVY